MRLLEVEVDQRLLQMAEEGGGEGTADGWALSCSYGEQGGLAPTAQDGLSGNREALNVNATHFSEEREESF